MPTRQTNLRINLISASLGADVTILTAFSRENKRKRIRKHANGSLFGSAELKKGRFFPPKKAFFA
jgi:hypothetical protein